jgi:hypothetical protein
MSSQKAGHLPQEISSSGTHSQPVVLPFSELYHLVCQVVIRHCFTAFRLNEPKCRCMSSGQSGGIRCTHKSSNWNSNPCLTYQFAAALITTKSSGRTPAKTCKASVEAVHQAVVRRRKNPLWAASIHLLLWTVVMTGFDHDFSLRQVVHS